MNNTLTNQTKLSQDAVEFFFLGGGGAFLPNSSQGCMDPTLPNLAKTQCDHDYTRSLFQSLDILLHFQMQVAQSCVMLKTTPNVALFDRCENYGRVGEISIPTVEALLTTESPEYI